MRFGLGGRGWISNGQSIDWPAVDPGDRTDDMVQAMVEMVMDQGAFGIGNGRFNRV